MKGYLSTTVLAGAALLASAPAPAQEAGDKAPLPAAIRQQYEAISASVVRLRTVADIQLSVPDPGSGLRSMVTRPLQVHGTGVIVGQVEVEGRTEYLILTNHHVADPSNYVVEERGMLRENRHNTQAVPTAHEETYLTASEGGEESPGDIRLVEVARDVRGDMALLRTVGAPAGMTQFTGQIGYRPGEVGPGGRIITSGYPHGGQKITDTGVILEVDRRHELGQPHDDFVLSLPVEHGQSGSPVFLVESRETEHGTETRFVLIGLLHARERGYSFMVPYSLWKESIERVPGTLVAQMVR